MVAPLYDAHCHLADLRLRRELESIQGELRAIHCRASIVNGTSPADWQQVLDHCALNPNALPAIGLHPWQVNTAPKDWQTQFLQALDGGVQIVGEIGLDQWIEGHDIDAQQTAFRWQLQQATEHNLPVSIHCLKALDSLMQTLRSIELPQRGIHLHALNAPASAAHQLIERGAYFSFNAGQLKPNAKHIFELIHTIPSDRILVETDAPDFLPPESYRTHQLVDTSLNHPANLRAAYQAIAEIRGESVETFASQVEFNFKRYFID
ncbi:MAG: TatD family hydrolase [Opitutaceae bacterium]